MDLWTLWINGLPGWAAARDNAGASRPDPQRSRKKGLAGSHGRPKAPAETWNPEAAAVQSGKLFFWSAGLKGLTLA